MRFYYEGDWLRILVGQIGNNKQPHENTDLNWSNEWVGTIRYIVMQMFANSYNLYVTIRRHL